MIELQSAPGCDNIHSNLAPVQKQFVVALLIREA